MAIEDTVKNWLGLAEYDFDTAGAMLKSGRYLYVAFTCQQCIEKTLKAIYVKEKLTTPPYTHNLQRLISEISIAPLLDMEQIDFTDSLNYYYIEGRYSEQLERMKANINERLANEIYDKTQVLYSWLKLQLI